MAENSGSTSGFTWFLAGAVCGAVVALLYAPNSGQNTRKLIVKKTDETRDALNDGGKDMILTANRIAEIAFQTRKAL